MFYLSREALFNTLLVPSLAQYNIKFIKCIEKSQMTNIYINI